MKNIFGIRFGKGIDNPSQKLAGAAFWATKKKWELSPNLALMTSWQRFLMGPPNVPDNDRSNWLTILHRVSDRHVHEVVELCVCVLHLCVCFCVWVGVWVHICVFVCVCIHLAGVINIVAMLSCTLVRIERMWVVEQSINNNNNNENWIKLYVTQWKIQTYLEPGWQKLRGSTGGPRRKVWTRTKILSPNIRYFVAN